MTKRSRTNRGEPRSAEGAQAQLVEALKALEAAAAAIVAEEGGAAKGLPHHLSVQLTVPIDTKTAAEARSAQAKHAVDAMRRQVAEGLKAAGCWRSGTVYAFQTREGEGPHARPPTRQDTFAGYSAHGRPQWISFLNLCIARGDDRVERLYAERPEIIAIAQTGRELTDGLLPGFGRSDRRFAVLGQVVTGLIPRGLNPRRSEEERVALTLQVVDVQSDAQGPRLRLNILGMSIEEVAGVAANARRRGPAESLRRTITETRRKVEAIDRQRARLLSDDLEGQERVLSQVPTLLTQLRGDMERVFRPATHRTQHGQDRHAEGQRPTSQAQRDLAEASDDRLLLDRKRHTFIVLGPRNRAHVFSPDGRHVTSIRVTPGELARKTDRSRWLPLEPERITEFRDRAASLQFDQE